MTITPRRRKVIIDVPDNLPAIIHGGLSKRDITNAMLPTLYTESCDALDKCARIDECREWSNKAHALASYAKQSLNTALEDCAKRIRNRATLRAAELLQEIDARGNIRGNNPSDKRTASEPFISRTKTAEDHGYTKAQRATMSRLVNLPRAQFHVLNEATPAPSLNQIVAAGMKRIKAAARERPAPVKQSPGGVLCSAIGSAHLLLMECRGKSLDTLEPMNNASLEHASNDVDEMLELLLTIRDRLDVILDSRTVPANGGRR